MYVPSYLEYLSRSGTADGWPPFVTEPAKAWAAEMIRRGFVKYGQMNLDQARRCVFDCYVAEPDENPPECLRGVVLLDALYAVAHRALLAVNAEQVWRAGRYTFPTPETPE